MPTPSRILLIGTRGKDSCSDLLKRLASSGSKVGFVADYREAFEQADTDDIQAMIIDSDPEVSRIIDFCRNLRSEHHYMPVLVLEDESTPVDRMLLLEAGADVCLARGTDARELFTLTRALMRRDGWCSCSRDQAKERGAVRVGRLHVCPLKKRAYMQGKDTDLTHVEFEILYFLAQHPGRVYSREEILKNLWGERYMCEPHTVDTHI